MDGVLGQLDEEGALHLAWMHYTATQPGIQIRRVLGEGAQPPPLPQEMEKEIRELHESLFPAMSEASPTSFPPRRYDQAEFVLQARWVHRLLVPAQGGDLVLAPMAALMRHHAHAPNVVVAVQEGQVVAKVLVDLCQGEELWLR